MTKEKLALEGYFGLAERSRNIEDKQFIKATIEKVLKTKINENEYYQSFYEENIRSSIIA